MPYDIMFIQHIEDHAITVVHFVCTESIDKPQLCCLRYAWQERGGGGMVGEIIQIL